MMNKLVQMNLQQDFKKRHNKPGSRHSSPQEAKAIRSGKQLVRTTD